MAIYDEYLIDISKIQFGTQIKTSDGVKVPINAKLYKNNTLYDIKDIYKFISGELKAVDKGIISAYDSQNSDNEFSFNTIDRVEERTLGDELVIDNSATVSEDTLYAIEYNNKLYYKYGSEIQDFIDNL